MPKTPEEQLGVPLQEEEATPLPQARPPEPEENVTDERPEWLPSKFKEPQHLVDSYSQLESKLGEQGQTISELQKSLEAMQNQQQEYEWPATDEDYLNQMYEENPAEAMKLTVQAQLRELQQQQWAAQQQYQAQAQAQARTRDELDAAYIGDRAAASMEAKYDDWPAFQARAKEILEGRTIPPDELKNLDAFENHVDEAYRLAKYENMVGQEQEMRDAGMSQDDINRLRKEQAQTLTARRSSPREQLAPEQQKALDLIAARNQQGKAPWY